MPRFSFQRRIRTISSEQYNVYDDQTEPATLAVGQVDVHYVTPLRLDVTLLLLRDLADEALEDMLSALDDDVLASAGIKDRKAHVTVLQAKERGVYAMDGPRLDDEEDEAPDESQIV
jgi:hypothetical protein